VGVLQVLCEEDLIPDFIVGVSAGALVGGAYCAGIDLDDLVEAFSRFTSWQFWRLARSRDGLAEMLRENLPDVLPRCLNPRFSAVITDLDSGRPAAAGHPLGPEAEHLEGIDLPTAIAASCAIPGAVPVVFWRGRHLCDGGVMTNLPVRLAHSAGVRNVIACDLGFMSSGGWDKKTRLGALYRAFDLMARRILDMERKRADVLISPDVEGHPVLSFTRSQELIQAGREAAIRALPAIRRLCGRG